MRQFFEERIIHCHRISGDRSVWNVGTHFQEQNMRALIHPGLPQVICGSSQSQASTVETSNADIRSTDARDRHERQIEIWFDEHSWK